MTVRVSRTVKLRVPTKVELVPDPDFPALFTAEPVTLPLNQSSAVFRIRVAREVKAAGERSVVIRATGLQDGKWPAISETRIPLILERGKAVAIAK